MKKKKLLSLFVTAVTALGVLSGCGSKDAAATQPASEAAGQAAETTGDKAVYRTLDEIKESGTVKIGVFSDKNPFGYVDDKGEYQGYDIYFGNRIGEDLGVDVEYVSTDAANRVEFLKTGKVDIILANFTVTPERAESVDFALPYMKVALGVVSPDDALITAPKQQKPM